MKSKFSLKVKCWLSSIQGKANERDRERESESKRDREGVSESESEGEKRRSKVYFIIFRK